MNDSNDFCNSLVDRIVPGKPSAKEQAVIEAKLGYEDRLLVMSETFALWAIESQNEMTQDLLSFSQIHPQIFIVPDIDKFRELKLRLLNGSHNLSCAVAIIAGFQMVRDAMKDTSFNRFIWRLIQDEIAAAIVSPGISLEEARKFGERVWERYGNPHIAFDWLDICVQDTSKIRIRAVPIVLQHYEKHSFVPDCICLGFSSYILFMKSKRMNGEYIGTLNGKQYKIIDDYAGLMFDKWDTMKGLSLVNSVLSDLRLWEADLSTLKGFPEKVDLYLENLLNYGFYHTFELIEKSK
jgi:tagaturonate reductase